MRMVTSSEVLFDYIVRYGLTEKARRLFIEQCREDDATAYDGQKGYLYREADQARRPGG